MKNFVLRDDFLVDARKDREIFSSVANCIMDFSSCRSKGFKNMRYYSRTMVDLNLLSYSRSVELQ